MGWLYQGLHLAAFAVGAPFYALRKGGVAKYRETIAPRFGHPPLSAPAGSAWIQAVSVGEVGVAEILAGALRSLRPDLPLLVTTTTVTGQARARAAFPADTVGWFPFDFAPVCRRAVAAVRPRVFVLVETEIWPGIIEELARARVPIVLVNARISDRSFPRYRAFAPFLAPTLRRLDRVLAASPLDAERLAALGVPADRLEVTGNLKFDREAPESALSWDADRPRMFGGRPVLVAGSTADGEEEVVVEAFRQASSDGRRAALVLAPRHPARFDEVAAFLARTPLRAGRRSAMTADGRWPSGAGEVDVLLLDTIGELSRAYRGAAGAFVGGSLVSRGGQNPLEAAVFGVPVAVGPNTTNFRDVVDALRRRGALEVTPGATRLAAVWGEWLDRPADAAKTGAAGREAIAASRGAAGRTAAVVSGMAR